MSGAAQGGECHAGPERSYASPSDGETVNLSRSGCDLGPALENREGAIGVFDSGLGGLTAVKELHALLPAEEIIYFGDTGRVPYGTRGRDTIIKYVRQDIHFLLEHHVKAVVVACGTASSVALPAIREDYEIPLCGVIEHAAAAAARATKNQKVAVMGTAATIGSGAYERELLVRNSGLSIQSTAAPLLVPLVENGRFGRDDPVARLVLEEYLAPALAFGADTLILGCTHYPLLRDLVSDIAPGLRLINPGAVTAQAVARMLRESGLLREAPAGEGHITCFVSDDPTSFAQNADRFLGGPIATPVRRVEIERY